MGIAGFVKQKGSERGDPERRNKERETEMPVLSKFDGIVIRMLIDRTFGMRLHAIYGDTELVMGLNPLRVIQGDVPSWVQEQTLDWATQHEEQFSQARNIDMSLATPVSRQSMQHLAFQN